MSLSTTSTCLLNTFTDDYSTLPGAVTQGDLRGNKLINVGWGMTWCFMCQTGTMALTRLELNFYGHKMADRNRGRLYTALGLPHF